MSDLAVFHRHLVRLLANGGTDRLADDVTIGTIRGDIMPYRLHRRSLGLDSVEDYDHLLLRLAGGEAGLAAVQEPTAARLLAAESIVAHPDLHLLKVHADAALRLDAGHAARALAEIAAVEADEGQAAADEARGVELVAADELPLDAVRRPGVAEAPVAPAAADRSAPICLCCGGTLPAGRTVRFCPHCGQNQHPACPECRAETELGWRHCVSCGAALPDAG